MNNTKKPSSINLLKFIVISLIGIFLFMWPIRLYQGYGEYSNPNIPLGHIITWLEHHFARIPGEYALNYLLTFVIIGVSVFFTLVAYLFKPAFIMDKPVLKNVFATHPVYIISRVLALIIVTMLFLDWGPDFIIDDFTGHIMLGITAHLVALFIILGPAMPLLTDFGLMEFIGVLIKKAVRFLFTLPGRSSIDLIASWFGSSAVGIMITSDQQDKGFYTGREAAVIATNFSFVSLPFTFVVASQIDMSAHFWIFYLVMCLTCIILALILPRIWPLRGIADEYTAAIGKQIEEDVPSEANLFSHAVVLASNRAGLTTFKDVVNAGAKNYLSIFMDLIPIILAWGTLAIAVAEFTPVFDYISFPMGWYLNILGVEGAFDYAAATLVGFVDMFIPAFLIGSANLRTRFILGVLSIVQIIYLAETGALILKSKIPLNFGKLFAIFILRTLIGLPLIVLLTNILFSY